MTNHYETVFITTPVLSDIQVKEAVEKFKNLLAEAGGVVEHEESWELWCDVWFIPMRNGKRP